MLPKPSSRENTVSADKPRHRLTSVITRVEPPFATKTQNSGSPQLPGHLSRHSEQRRTQNTGRSPPGNKSTSTAKHPKLIGMKVEVEESSDIGSCGCSLRRQHYTHPQKLLAQNNVAVKRCKLGKSLLHWPSTTTNPCPLVKPTVPTNCHHHGLSVALFH